MKRNTPFTLIAALLCMGVLTACGDTAQEPSQPNNEQNPGQTQTEAATAEAPLYDDQLPDQDMQGYQLTFFNYTDASLDWALKDIDRTETTGDLVNDAIYHRNRRVEERFNAVISEIYSGSVVDTFKREVTAGDTTFSVAQINDESLNGVHVAGCLETWDVLPYVDLTREWWNQDANATFRLGESQYAAVGDYNLAEYSKSYLYFFNKDLYQSLGFDDDLYQLVRDGKWTKDALLSIAKQVSRDLNGDGVMTEDDQYGLAETTKVHYQMLITGAGFKFVDVDKDGTPYFAVPGNERMLSYMQQLINDHKDTTWYYASPEGMGGVPNDVFKKGNTLFVSATMWNTEMYRDYAFDIGMLPAPKMDEAQERYYSITTSGLVSVLPKTIADAEKEPVGILLEALAADSHYHVLPVYKEVTLQSKYARDAGSADMIDIIFDSQVFDLGVTIWTDVRYTYMANVFHKLSDKLASLTETIDKKTVKAIQKTIDALDDIG